MQIGVSVVGANSVAKGLDAIGRRVTDLRPAWTEIADDFLEISEDVFDTAGASIGRRWKPNVAWWAAFKAAEFGWSESEDGPLVQRPPGRLKQSLTVKNAPYSLRDVRPAQLRMGTTLGIAAIHQKGGTLVHKRGNRSVTVRVPARPFVRPRQQAKRWTSFVDDYVLTGRGGLNRTGGI